MEDAYKACSSIKEQGVSVRSTLAADKTNETQQALRVLFGVNSTLDAYIGVTIHVLFTSYNSMGSKEI